MPNSFLVGVYTAAPPRTFRYRLVSYPVIINAARLDLAASWESLSASGTVTGTTSVVLDIGSEGVIAS